jgi:hydroxymethylpyrimidine pyrophosphatase-like HAD family hydrolase
LTQYRLVVTDLDGTLLHPSGVVHEADQRAVAELKRRGVIVSIATGRMYSGTRSIAHGLGLKGPVACIDGSHLVDVETDQELLSHPISGHGRRLLRSVLEDLAVPSVVFSEDRLYHDDRTTEYLPYLLTWSDRMTPLEDVLHQDWWASGAQPAATVSLGLEEVIRQARERLLDGASEELHVVTFEVAREAYSKLWGMIVRASGASKGTAVEWIAKHHGLSLSEVVTVGDWINDIPMLKAAGRSFAMAQAPAEVAEAATDRLEANAWTGGAIAELAERCGLL